MQLQSEAGSYLLQACPRTVFVELVAVVAEENEVSLVVHGDDSTSLQVGHLREQRGQHASDSVSKHRVEVVHDQFGLGHSW